MLLAALLKTLGWIAVAVAALVAGFGLLILPHNLRVRRVRRDYRALPVELRRGVRQAISQFAASRPAVTLLCPAANETQDDRADVCESRAGGAPYREADQPWPVDEDGQPATFLIQARIDRPSLGDAWQGRLVQVFVDDDYQPIAVSRANPHPERHAALPPPCELLPSRRLEHVLFPAEPGEGGEPPELLPVSCRRLLELLPSLGELLRPHTTDPAGVAAQILAPEIYGYEIDGPWTAYVGGSPYLIQNEHDARCPTCGEALRFLLFFGEVVPEYQIGDAGCCCVYGCDRHPDQLLAFFDTH